jgi:hypothetical protein
MSKPSLAFVAALLFTPLAFETLEFFNHNLGVAK